MAHSSAEPAPLLPRVLVIAAAIAVGAGGALALGWRAREVAPTLFAPAPTLVFEMTPTSLGPWERRACYYGYPHRSAEFPGDRRGITYSPQLYAKPLAEGLLADPEQHVVDGKAQYVHNYRHRVLVVVYEEVEP